MTSVRERLKDWWWAFQKNRPAQVAVAIGFVVIAAGVIGAAYYWSTQRQRVVVTNQNANTLVNNDISGDEVRRKIDGVVVAKDKSNFLPVSVMIENLVQIRPQSGLGQANIIYEALAEGGITRFMAIYASGDPIEKIGPVRSARHYYVDIAEEYGGIYAHVGGSPQALGILGSEDYVTDLNQFSYAQFFYRDQDIAAPHNLFTSSELLGYALRDLALMDKPGDFETYTFKDVMNKADRPTGIEPITINFSNADYAVEWRYDRDHDQYLRWNGGKEHIDANTDEQLSARNILVQWVDSSVIEPDSGRLDVVTTGTGDAILFRDGEVIEATWEKTERGVRTQFNDKAGQALVYNPGTTWVELVPKGNTVSY